MLFLNVARWILQLKNWERDRRVNAVDAIWQQENDGSFHKTFVVFRINVVIASWKLQTRFRYQN